MIESGTFYYAVCDGCGERIALDPDYGYTVDETAAALREAIKEYDGEVAEDGTVTCPGCCEERKIGT